MDSLGDVAKANARRYANEGEKAVEDLVMIPVVFVVWVGTAREPITFRVPVVEGSQTVRLGLHQDFNSQFLRQRDNTFQPLVKQGYGLLPGDVA